MMDDGPPGLEGDVGYHDEGPPPHHWNPPGLPPVDGPPGCEDLAPPGMEGGGPGMHRGGPPQHWRGGPPGMRPPFNMRPPHGGGNFPRPNFNNRGSPRGGGMPPRGGGFRGGPPPPMFGGGPRPWGGDGNFPPGPMMGGGPPPNNPMFTDITGDVWIEYKNDTGRPYYYNCKTQKTVWVKPQVKEDGAPSGGPPQQQPPPQRFPPPFTAPIPDKIWSEHRTDEGRTYYYNGVTKQSVWQRPKEMDEQGGGPPPQQPPMGGGPGGDNKAPPHLLYGHQQRGDPPPSQSPAASVAAAALQAAQNLQQNQPSSVSIPGVPDSVAPAIIAARAAAAALAANINKKLEGGGAIPDSMGDSGTPPPDEMEMGGEGESSSDQDDAPPPTGADPNKPVAINSIIGTTWCVVWTGDCRSFFYNSLTKESHWVMPDELQNNLQVQKLLANPPKSAKKHEKPASDNMEHVKKRLKLDRSEPRPDPNIIINPVNEQPKQQEETLPKETEPKQSEEEDKEEGGEEKTEEEEVKYVKEKMSLDERQAAFRQLLVDREVSAFSTWEKELHKIVFDQRYLLLSGRERKQAYDTYVKSRAEEERIEKRNKLKENREQFKKLVESANLSSRASFSDFAQKFGKEARFKAIEKMKEREQLFNDVKREKREDPTAKRDEDDRRDRRESRDGGRDDSRRDDRRDTRDDRRDSRRDERRDDRRDDRRESRGDDRKDRDERSRDRYTRERKDSKEVNKVQKIKDEFFEMLKNGDVKIKPDSPWNKKKKYFFEEDRYHAVGSSALREEYFYEYTKLLGEEKKKKEKKEDKEEKEPKTEEVEKKEDKKEVEQEVEKPKLSDSEKKALEKREREAAAMKRREGDVARKQVDQSREWERERGAHAQEEAKQHFTALLHDMVRDPDASWRKTRKQLKDDTRWEMTSLLDVEQKEKLFTQHIESLSSKRKRAFVRMLDECEHVNLTSTWKEVRRKIKHDSRFSKLSDDDKEREAEYDRYITDKLAQAKADFRTLLGETKCITYRSKETLRGSTGDTHMRELKQFLKNDKRGLVLDDLPDDRDRILEEFLTELEKVGPPPPPTATKPLAKR